MKIIEIEVTDEEFDRFMSLSEEQRSYPITCFIRGINIRWQAKDENLAAIALPEFPRFPTSQSRTRT